MQDVSSGHPVPLHLVDVVTVAVPFALAPSTVMLTLALVVLVNLMSGVGYSTSTVLPEKLYVPPSSVPSSVAWPSASRY